MKKGSNRTEWAQAKRHLAGGVNSPVRAFKAVGGSPVFFSHSFGPYLYDVEGRRYVDYCMSWGAAILGHADEGIACAIRRQLPRGTSFGAATPYETVLASSIQRSFPMMRRIRFTSSGTEAAMSAIRLARGFTGRSGIVKFEGCYHGHADSLLVKAGSGLATFGHPDSAGVPEETAAWTTVLPYNDIPALEKFFRGGKQDPPACVIVEPVAGNMGVVAPAPGFLEALRRACDRSGALLIFDEVISGFRVSGGGAQKLFGIQPDITVLGKIIGGGLPVGAFGASAEIMAALAPDGPVYQAGTLSGNPLSMAAGQAALSRLSDGLYEDLEAAAKDLTARLRSSFRKRGEDVSIARVGSMFTVFFAPKLPKNYQEVVRCDKKRFARFFRRMLSQGIYWPPSAFEASFISAAHGPEQIERTCKAVVR